MWVDFQMNVSLGMKGAKETHTKLLNKVRNKDIMETNIFQVVFNIIIYCSNVYCWDADLATNLNIPL